MPKLTPEALAEAMRALLTDSDYTDPDNLDINIDDQGAGSFSVNYANGMPRSWCFAEELAGALRGAIPDLRPTTLVTAEDVSWHDDTDSHPIILLGDVQAGWMLEVRAQLGEYTDEDYDGSGELSFRLADQPTIEARAQAIAREVLGDHAKALGKTFQSLSTQLTRAGLSGALEQDLRQVLRATPALSPLMALWESEFGAQALSQVIEAPVSPARKPRI